jgi:hypothetical protein
MMAASRQVTTPTATAVEQPVNGPLDHRDPVDDGRVPARPQLGRIIGLDLARAMAMLGMVFVHYVWPDDSGSAVDVVADALRGRAMPLFVLLGGVGVTLAVERFRTPDRALLVRAVLLFALGVLVDEWSEWVAVILQWYGLMFAVAPLLRRLPSPALLITSASVAIGGSWTFQVMGDWPRHPITWHDLDNPIYLARALVVDGSYPFFPVAAFFILGLWIGRLDLRSDRVAAWLTGVGALVGFGTLLITDAIIDRRGINVNVFDAAKREPNPSGYDPSRFWAEQLLDTTGHSQMLGWVVSAAGTSVAVIGLCLLVAPRAPRVVAPLVSLGRMALTFYVFQVVLTRWVPYPSTTNFAQELATVAAIYLGFVAFAHLWLRVFRAGPLEALLRVGSGRPRSEMFALRRAGPD